MQTELGFLIELLLKHKLAPSTKDLIAERIKDVEQSVGRNPNPIQHTVPKPMLGGVQQAASTIAALAKYPDLVEKMNGGIIEYTGSTPPPQPVPVAVIAQTPETQAALTARTAIINTALSGKPEKGRTSPRKF